MRRGSALRVVAVAAWVVAVCVAAALAVVEPALGQFVVSGALLGALVRLVTRAVTGRTGRDDRRSSGDDPPAGARGPERAPAPPSPAWGRSAGRRMGRTATIAVLLTATASVAVLTDFYRSDRPRPLPDGRPRPGPPDEPPPPLLRTRVLYATERTYVRSGGWSGSETLTLDLATLRPVLWARPRRPVEERLARVLPAPWTFEHEEREGQRRLYVFRRPARRVPFAEPAWRPLTTSHTIPLPAVRVPRLRALLVPDRDSTLVLHAPARRVHGTTPASEPGPDERAGWEQREVPLGPAAVSSRRRVVVEVRSDLATLELFPEQLIDITGWGLLKWLFGALGFGAVVSERVRKLLFGWMRRAARGVSRGPTAGGQLRPMR